jgi:hypothetical protein
MRLIWRSSASNFLVLDSRRSTDRLFCKTDEAVTALILHISEVFVNKVIREMAFSNRSLPRG